MNAHSFAETAASMSRSRTIIFFAATAIVSGAVSVLSIPIIVTLTGATAWGSIALAQGVGSSIGVLTMFGWGVTGPAEIAMMFPAKHAAAYFDSVVARGLLFLPALLLTVGISWFVVPSDRVAAMVCGVAMACGGLSGSWFLVGKNRPDRLFLYDTIPRVLGTIVGVGILWLTHSLVLFGVCQLLGSLAAFVSVTLWALPALRRPRGTARGLRQIVGVISGQRHGVAVAVAISSYFPIVLTFVAFFAPASLPLYALVEKLLRFATMALQPIFQFFQATVPRYKGDALAGAIRRSFYAMFALSILCWVAFSALLPVAGDILAAGTIEVPLVVDINLGAYMGAIVLMSHMTTVTLVSVNRLKAISRSALGGALFGLIVVMAFALVGNGHGISWGFVASAAFSLTYQFIALAKATPRDYEATEAGESEAAT